MELKNQIPTESSKPTPKPAAAKVQMGNIETGGTVAVDGNELVIRIPYINPPRLSSEGKSFLLASTQAYSNLVINGQPVKVGLNAYIKNPDFVKPPKSARR